LQKNHQKWMFFQFSQIHNSVESRPIRMRSLALYSESGGESYIKFTDSKKFLPKVE